MTQGDRLDEKEGACRDVEPGTKEGFHYRQNLLREVFVSDVSLRLINQRCGLQRMRKLHKW